MRFPLRFTSDFQLGVIARGMQARGHAALVVKLAPFAEGGGMVLPAVEWAPRLVWIGGAEPLEYSEIPRFANALAASGREVFLHTNGAMLRRRMHEFQPTARFRFVLRLDGSAAADNEVAVDAVRGAQLSGFLVCALSVVRGDEDVEALAKLHAELHGLDLDGYLIVPATRTASASGVLREARDRLLNRRWRRLSEMFDFAMAEDAASVGAEAPAVRRAARDSSGGAAAVISRRNAEQGSRDQRLNAEVAETQRARRGDLAGAGGEEGAQA